MDAFSFCICVGVFFALKLAIYITRRLLRDCRTMSPFVVAVLAFIVAFVVVVASLMFLTLETAAKLFVIGAVLLNMPSIPTDAPVLSENGEQVKKALERKKTAGASTSAAGEPARRTSARLASSGAKKSWREILRTERAK